MLDVLPIAPQELFDVIYHSGLNFAIYIAFGRDNVVEKQVDAKLCLPKTAPEFSLDCLCPVYFAEWYLELHTSLLMTISKMSRLYQHTYTKNR